MQTDTRTVTQLRDAMLSSPDRHLIRLGLLLTDRQIETLRQAFRSAIH